MSYYQTLVDIATITCGGFVVQQITNTTNSTENLPGMVLSNINPEIPPTNIEVESNTCSTLFTVWLPAEEQESQLVNGIVEISWESAILFSSVTGYFSCFAHNVVESSKLLQWDKAFTVSTPDEISQAIFDHF